LASVAAEASDDDGWQDYVVGSSGEPEPIVNIRVTGPGGSHTDGALVDSGAEVTAFPEKWMPFLGINKTDCVPQYLDTADGDGKLWVCEKVMLDLTVVGVTFPVEAAFSGTSVALLGRDDLFARFRITFEHWDKRMRLEPYDGSSPSLS